MGASPRGWRRVDVPQVDVTDADLPDEPAAADERRLVAALRAGDEAAFGLLIDRHNSMLLRLARLYVGDPAVAEEVVQETWLGVLRGLDRFEGRSSLKTWICRILANRAKTRAEREGRSIPFSALWEARDEPDETVDADRFHPAGHPGAGHWATPPRDWEVMPEERLLSAETRQRVRAAIDALPANQRMVISLRDVEGWSAAEVCNALAISETNQRVLLHRARGRVRRTLERYLAEA
jgi:RNA polymerase sigma-70 factor (ECF subfamily)